MTQGWEPDPYIVALTGAGILIALVVWLPLAVSRRPISLPIVCLVIGGLVFASGYVDIDPSPQAHPYITERLTEFVVIVALMGAGLKIDRVFSFKTWCLAWRLLLITMPVSIAAIMIVGMSVLGLSVVPALLLAASLAPTDPVLAADIQVGGPLEGGEDTVRFALTSEASLNDGFAFPFVHLAIALSLSASTGEPWLSDWLTYNILWETTAGVICGWLIGRLFGWLTFRMPGDTLAKTGDGLVAIAATFVSYGVSEMLQCYGFFAVFVTALTLRASHRNHDFQRDMHDITEQIERITMMVLLLAFGGAIAGGLLADIGLAGHPCSCCDSAGHSSPCRASGHVSKQGDTWRESLNCIFRDTRCRVSLLLELCHQSRGLSGCRQALGDSLPCRLCFHPHLWPDSDPCHALARPNAWTRCMTMSRTLLNRLLISTES